jgi:hypothetical protein
MRLHESHDDGGFGVSHNTIIRLAASYTTNARFVAFLGTFACPAQQVWMPGTDLQDPTSPFARGPPTQLRMHRSAGTSPAIRWRLSCGQRRRTPSASARRLPRRRQRQAGSPATQPPPRGIQAQPNSLLGVFQLSRPAAQPAHTHSHTTPPHTAANQALGTLQGPPSAIRRHAFR